jgi:hypothetical protein
MFVHVTWLPSPAEKLTHLSLQISQHVVFTLMTLHLLSMLIHQKSTKHSFTVQAVQLAPVQKALLSPW